MSWSSWGPQGADGTGTAVFKICDPNCAAGYQLTDPVVVHAWNPQPPRPDAICQAGLKIFADMILAFPKDVPPPTAQQMDTQYNGMPAVHYANYSGANAPSSSATRSVTDRAQTSMTTAPPWPPPAHIAATPIPPPRRASS